MKRINDEKHAELQDRIETMLEDRGGLEVLETESYYNNYGERGWVDIVVKEGDNVLHLIEVKHKIRDLGKTIRQVKRAEKNYPESFEEKKKVYNLKGELIVESSDHNISILSKYDKLIKSSGIPIYLYKNDRITVYNNPNKTKLNNTQVCSFCGEDYPEKAITSCTVTDNSGGIGVKICPDCITLINSNQDVHPSEEICSVCDEKFNPKKQKANALLIHDEGSEEQPFYSICDECRSKIGWGRRYQSPFYNKEQTPLADFVEK